MCRGMGGGKMLAACLIGIWVAAKYGQPASLGYGLGALRQKEGGSHHGDFGSQ